METLLSRYLLPAVLSWMVHPRRRPEFVGRFVLRSAITSLELQPAADNEHFELSACYEPITHKLKWLDCCNHCRSAALAEPSPYCVGHIFNMLMLGSPMSMGILKSTKRQLMPIFSSYANIQALLQCLVQLHSVSSTASIPAPILVFIVNSISVGTIGTINPICHAVHVSITIRIWSRR